MTTRRSTIAQRVREVLAQNPLILDTETTGLKDWDEIVQISIIDLEGTVLLDTLVKPSIPIPYDAQRVHHITDAMVANERRWGLVCNPVFNLISGRNVVIYNADYDTRLLKQSSDIAGLPFDWREETTYWCAMKAYAEFNGEWSDYRNSWAWQPLERACRQMRLTLPELPAHSALGDCLRTLALLKAMAAYGGEG